VATLFNEATTKQVAHGDVEHYRPKSIYWWLAYCYDNYLVSCQICNEVFKRDKFPIAGNQLIGPTVTANTTDDELKKWRVIAFPTPLMIWTECHWLSLRRSTKPNGPTCSIRTLMIRSNTMPGKLNRS
jgi:hypothetical protein